MLLVGCNGVAVLSLSFFAVSIAQATAIGLPHGFRDTSGSFTTIDVPSSDALFSEPYSINDSGQIVGFFRAHGPTNPESGYLYDAGVFTALNVPGAVTTVATGINDAGQIVGDFRDRNGQFGVFVYAAGTFTNIGVFGALAYGINARGQIVGDYYEGANNTEGFLYTAGSITDIDVPGAMSTAAYGINDAGQIVGSFTDSKGFHGFL